MNRGLIKLEKKLMKTFGKSLGVFHSIVDEGNMHIDCELFLSKIKGYEFYTLTTLGLSDYTMHEAYEGYKNIELVIHMPKSWDYNKEVWPINLLKLIGQIPSSDNTVLCPFHTVRFNETFVKDKFKSVLIEFPRLYTPKKTTFKIDGVVIRCLQVYPLYDNELNEIIEENEDVMNEVVKYTIFDENRESVAK